MMIAHSMRAAICAVAITCAFIPGAQASDKSDVEATLRAAFAAANAGHMDTLGKMIAADGVVIDEFAPFHWTGFASWTPAYGAYNEQNAITNSRTKILRFKEIKVSGTHAYAVLDVALTYKEHGKPRKELGTEAFVLEKTAAGWISNSFAWFSKGGVDQGADATAVLAAIHKELDTPNPTTLPWKGIIDEFPAYHWQGDGAAAGWGGDFQKSGQELVKLDAGAPEHLSVNGDAAYVVLPTTIDLKVKGKPVREKGRFVFAMVRTNGAWQTHSWAWVLN
ncbi:MAG: nuclear transport factor 2 family protein [Alphaproteobacteria bacterium]|nr:nuclear transport factor 2 family protein [Alphaproteobacteria bacterium]